LHAAGYLAPNERPYLAAIERRLADAGLSDRFTYHGEPDHAGKLAFLRSLDVFCLPATFPESKGLPVVEAWAAGIPVVLPRLGAFPEMIANSDAGLLHDPHDAASLAEVIASLLGDGELAARFAGNARAAFERNHTDQLMAERTIAVYDRVMH
jgi:glycosyltransferase involved in cell wall biosynthesis